jgi:acyl-CoA thioester hydrolase
MTDTRTIPSLPMFSFEMPVDVRFRDLDAMGHVNNAVFATYLEMGRVGYLRAAGAAWDQGTPATEMFPFVLAELTIRYLAPITLDSKPILRVRVPKVGRSSFEFEYLLALENGTPAAWGSSAQVSFDYEKSESIEMPEMFRKMLEDFEGRDLSPLND